MRMSCCGADSAGARPFNLTPDRAHQTTSRMILSLVSEILSRVARNPEIDQALDTLRRSKGEVHLSGLTDPAKAFVSAVATAQLGRPTDSNRRNRTSALKCCLNRCAGFIAPVSRKPGRRVAHLPAYDVLPYESPFAARGNFGRSRGRALAIALSEADLPDRADSSRSRGGCASRNSMESSR